MIRVFMGFDAVETVSYHVLAPSIQARALAAATARPQDTILMSGRAP